MRQMRLTKRKRHRGEKESCHPERSEGSLADVDDEILRYAQNDTTAEGVDVCSSHYICLNSFTPSLLQTLKNTQHDEKPELEPTP